MSTGRSNKSKSTGLRILWIPGSRKKHPKGRFDSTNKQISYGSHQKKNEVWSLGGSKAHNDFVKVEPNTTLLDGPSVSGLPTAVNTAAPLACLAGEAAAIANARKLGENGETGSTITTTTTTVTTLPNENNPQIPLQTPNTPGSTTSTAPLTSVPNSPEAHSAGTAAVAIINDKMPSKTSITAPMIIRTTTTAEILDENRFSILTKDGTFDPSDLPSPPQQNGHDDSLVNTSAGTTASTATTPSTSPKNEANKGGTSETESPTKRRLSNKNHNNNQGDVNSIESIADNEKIPSSDLSWLDDLHGDEDIHNKETLPKSKHKKKKKRSVTAKELDQLDGVPTKENLANEKPRDEDEKVVKCLYYTLMCCDCTIS